jgi:hypothetical protein
MKRGINTGKMASEMALVMGSEGSDGITFDQDGGIKVDKVSEALSLATEIVINQVTKRNP